MNNDKMPVIMKWGLYFKETLGCENRDAAAKEFVKFWSDRNADKVKLSNKLMLGGEVYGREGFEDGENIFTSSVIVIERIGRNVRDGVPHDLMRATTTSGSEYLFYSDEYNPATEMILDDIICTDRLNPRPYFYVEPEFRDYKII